MNPQLSWTVQVGQKKFLTQIIFNPQFFGPLFFGHTISLDQMRLQILDTETKMHLRIYIYKSIVIYMHVYEALTDYMSVVHMVSLSRKFSVYPGVSFGSVSLNLTRFCLRGHKNCILMLCPRHDFPLCVPSFYLHHHRFFHI